MICIFREELRTTPEKIDAMMESKHVLSAAKLLETSLKQAMSSEMMQIGALDDIRRTLTAQKNVRQIKKKGAYKTNGSIKLRYNRHFMTCLSKNSIIICI